MFGIWYEIACIRRYTLPTDEILSGKNARAWVSMVLYLRKEMKIETKKKILEAV